MGVEGGDLIDAITDDRHAQSLQPLAGAGQVQNGLGPGADHQHRNSSQCGQVGGFVIIVAAVDAAQTAGGEDLDIIAMGHPHGGGDGSGGVQAAGGHDAEIAQRGFDHIAALGEMGDLLGREARDWLALPEAAGAGVSSRFAGDSFQMQSGFVVFGPGQAMGNNGGFEGDEG